MMSSLVDLLSCDIQKTIEALKVKKFRSDPVAHDNISKIVSIMSSAYKRHGFILEKAILEQLKTNPNFDVWEDREFFVPQIADHLVDSVIDNPTRIFETETHYRADGHRMLQIDAIIFNRTNNQISAYEIKRGHSLHDSGKRRSILRDLLCVHILLKSYGIKKGYTISCAKSFIIFYYGQCSIGKPFSITREELDDHFGYSVKKDVEDVNEYFRSQLSMILPL